MVARAPGSRTVLGFGSRPRPGSVWIISSSVMVVSDELARASGVSDCPAPLASRVRAADVDSPADPSRIGESTGPGPGARAGGSVPGRELPGSGVSACATGSARPGDFGEPT